MDRGERQRLENHWRRHRWLEGLRTTFIEDAAELRGWLVGLRRADWRSIDRGLLALAGLTLLGQVAYPVGWVIAGSVQHGYSLINNYVSDLGARTAADAWIMNTGLILFGASFLALAVALGTSLPQSRARTVAVWWVVAFGVAVVATGILHEDCWATTRQICRAQQQAGALSWHHYAHGYLSLAWGLLVDLSPLILVFALPSGLLRRVCGACALVGVAGAIAAISSTAAGVGYRDGQGLVERIVAGIINCWVLALFVAMLLADLIAKSHDGRVVADHAPDHRTR